MLDFPKPWFPIREGRANLPFDVSLAEAIIKAPPRYRSDEYPAAFDFLHHFLLVAHQLCGFTPLFDRRDLRTICVATQDVRVEFVREYTGSRLSYAFPGMGIRQVVLMPNDQGQEQFDAVLQGDHVLLYCHLNRVMEVLHRLRHKFPAKNKRRP